MTGKKHHSSPLVTLLLLIGSTTPALAQKAIAPSPEKNVPQQTTEVEIALLKQQRADAVWLEKFIVGHASQIDIESDLLLVSNPCENFAKNNPKANAKDDCESRVSQYLLIQTDMEIGTEALKPGWKEEITAGQKRMEDNGWTGPVHTEKVYASSPDYHTNPAVLPFVASAIGRLIDFSQGVLSQERGIVFEKANLLEEIQMPMAAPMRSRIEKYVVDQSKAPADKVKDVKVAIADSTKQAGNAAIIEWYYLTQATQKGFEHNIEFVVTAAGFENLIGSNMVKAASTANDVVTGKYNDVLKSEN